MTKIKIRIILVLIFTILPLTATYPEMQVITSGVKKSKGAKTVTKQKKHKPAKKKKSAAKKVPPYNFYYEFETMYDSNPYKYSSDLREKYSSGEDRDTRFKHVESLWDIDNRLTLGIIRNAKIFKNLFTRAGLETFLNFYCNNTIKNFQKYSAFIEQQLNKKSSLELRYSNIPKYFMKYLLDSDISTSEYDRFRKYSYREDSFDAILRYRPSRDWFLRLRYRYEYDDYVDEFKEWDSGINSVRLDVSKYCSKFKTRTGLFYEYTNSAARGYDDEPSHDIDPSYNQNELGFTLWMPVYKDIRLYAWYSYAYRAYDSRYSISQDPLHTDRIDRIQTAELKFVKPVRKNLDIFCRYEYQYRDPSFKASPEDTSSEPYTGYLRNTVSLGIEGRF